MPIPLYFAANVEISDEKVMQLGYGLYPDGTIRVPKHRIADVPIVIDDAEPVPVSAARTAELCAFGESGIYFDFERPFCEYHRQLLAQARQLTEQIWLPEGYPAENALPVCTCPRPCNCWTDFLAAAQRRHPRGWAWEIIPWYAVVTYSGAPLPPSFLENAVCMAQVSDGRLHYFDTHETIRKKLKLAEQYGCRSAVCLRSEWQEM